ncbi:tRNA pseudouridine(38-40) synthase TruA [Agromyces aerolatus]|uniref:tRNA pseudouridine(38-40) synthase TruA n=1 Tax=Agromyces sp. LY-1074 TaxID=3074080 RepID=UPI002857E965|nr:MULTISPECIES: tRNA pseudouridine(38-40) synthase TruA [unclassified Agromyces]MDR5698368.1 tRNA pseudouridine(38-40) synthase TruA [Agromyces sp. LY-1074]MDR5704662.1 tRNA pseudouridine(38-40) synthase TruA [Agromyces sp. LY-1358]
MSESVPDASGGADASGETVRVRLGVAYDGTAFNGWSRQPGLRTVQGVLERALATLFRRAGVEPRLTVAGRTDAGVHALGQVAHLDVPRAALDEVARPRRGDATSGLATDPAGVLARRLTGILGSADDDVVITHAELAPDGFDARFSAVWRRYEYRVADRRALRDPLDRRRTVWYPRELDVEAMDEAARTLTGLHDFAAYCKPREEATTIRTLQAYGWRRRDDGVLVASLQADAFCHSMVRALVGACVAVGERRLEASDPAVLLAARERTSAFKVMPAKGLVLTEVGYPPDDELAGRAAQTRARRELRIDGIVG